MACVNCAKIRAAILHGKMAEAAGLTVDALREKFGLSDGAADASELPVTDNQLPSLSGKTKAELLVIADEEDAEVTEGATNAEIVAAIEAKRALVPA